MIERTLTIASLAGVLGLGLAAASPAKCRLVPGIDVNRCLPFRRVGRRSDPPDE
jgi:hypothetical protein